MPKAQPLQPEQPARSSYDPRLEMKGMRAGIVVLVGIAIGNVATALFHLITARWLGPSRYADLAALLALVGIVSFGDVALYGDSEQADTAVTAVSEPGGPHTQSG